MDSAEHQHRAREWADRLRTAAGDLTLPAHLAYRIAALVDPADAVYVDVDVPVVAGARMDIDVLVLTAHLAAIGESRQTTPPGRSRGLDETTRVSIKSLQDLSSVEVGGYDVDWETGPHGDDLHLGNRAVTATFADGTQIVLPQNDRSRSQVFAAIVVLQSALCNRTK